MVPLFKSLGRPILEYGNVVWSPSLKKNTVHNHTVIMHNAQFFTNNSNILEITGMTCPVTPTVSALSAIGTLISSFALQEHLIHSKNLLNE